MCVAFRIKQDLLCEWIIFIYPPRTYRVNVIGPSVVLCCGTTTTGLARKLLLSVRTIVFKAH